MALTRHMITTDELNQEVSISQKRKRKKKVGEKLNVGLGGGDDNIEANKGFAYNDTKHIANLIANKLKTASNPILLKH